MIQSQSNLANSRRSEKRALASEKEIESLNRELAEKKDHLQEALAESELANKAKTTFLSNMSHDIRTPMNAIIGYTALAEGAIDDREQVMDYLVKISAASEHLLSLINDVLDMSRIESGRLSLREEEFSLKDLLVQVNTIISGQCNDKGLTYEFHIKGSIAHSYLGDDLKLKQVLINILGNAVKFTPAPGKVIFRVQQKECVDDNCTLEFIMSDTGVGMSEEFLPKLFDAFTQENAKAQSKYGSTGLGMSIARNIVQMMHGDITVESKKGEGTTFTVVVTLKDAKKGTLTEEDVMHAEESLPEVHEKAAVKNDLEGIRVLIVEDMMVNAQMLGKILDTRGVLHEWAENGQLGLERFAQSEPHYYDAIIMDLQMPVMDGLTAAKEIRALDRDDAKETPIIAVSANAFSEDVQSSLEAGMNAHISKPIEIPVLFETLAKFVGTKEEKET